MTTKGCPGCRKLKSLREFHLNRRMASGRASWCKECVRASLTEGKIRRRLLSLARYGGKCACCGEVDDRLLTFDHVDPCGRPGRNKNMVYSTKLAYGDIDPNIRVLCFNCNCGRQKNGGICPHRDNYRGGR